MPEKLTRKSIRKLLEALATDENRNSIEKYFKHGIDAIGVKAPDIRPIAREAAKWCRFNGGFAQAMKLAKPLWKRGALEERMVALSLLTAFPEEFDDRTWALCDDWVDDLKDWASCDYLSADIIGAHLDGSPERRKELVKWTRSKNLWRRRAAAVALVKHARKGKYLADVWRVAAPLMPDEEDMVRKGVGWLLREAARTAPGKVVTFCKKHEERAARLILRTAAETMSKSWREKLLGKRKKRGKK